jgi:hypothetical protein
MSNKSFIDKAKDTMEGVTEKTSDTTDNMTKFQKQTKLKVCYFERY